MPVVEDFQEIAPLLGREWRQAPVIEADAPFANSCQPKWQVRAD
jgi:hypothetical protein